MLSHSLERDFVGTSRTPPKQMVPEEDSGPSRKHAFYAGFLEW